MAQALPSAARSSRSWRTSSRPTGPSSSLPRYAATWAARSALASKIAARGEMAEWSNAADSKSVVPIGYRGFESLSLRHTSLALFRSLLFLGLADFGELVHPFQFRLAGVRARFQLGRFFFLGRRFPVDKARTRSFKVCAGRFVLALGHGVQADIRMTIFMSYLQSQR